MSIINHGGLTQINSTYELFVSMEYELCKHLSKQVPNFDDVQAGNEEIKMYSFMVYPQC